MTDAGDPVRVLLVDDEVAVAEVTGIHLERQRDRFDVVVAEGAAEAVDRLDDDVDCVVSDYEMPGTDGLDLLRGVREYDPTLPFVLFTGRGSEEIASEAIAAGVTDYLQKGTGTEQYAVLANRVENAVARRRSEAVAVETESRYRTLVESSPNAVLVHDGTAVRYANERLADVVGADDPEAVYDTDPTSLVHEADRDRLAERVEHILTDREPVDWLSWRLRRVDGEIRHVESRAAPVRYEGATASQVVIRDVTERYRRERRLESLHEATRRLLAAADRETVARVTVETVEEVFDEPVAIVWEARGDGPELHPVAATETAAAVAREAGLEPDTDPLPPWTVEVEALRRDESRVVEDYGERDDTVTDAFETVILYPLDDHGLLSVGHRDPRSVDPTERDLLGTLSRSVAAALERLADEAS